MKRSKIFRLTGLTVLVVLFGLSAWRVARHERRDAAPDVLTIRFAHWQLESGLRAAYDAMAVRYMELHPNVRVEQIAIPDVVYGSWLRTQLVGGTAPDLIEFGQIPTGVGDELLARNFTPMTADLEQPNPYNRGTPLENVSWRETFIDGLEGVYRSSNLQDYYKIPMGIFTVRVYYNRALWRAVLGDTPEPTTFGEMQEITRRIQAHAARENQTLFPLASAGQSFQPVDRLFGAQTQRLALALDKDRNYFTTAPEIAIGALRGEWDMDRPELVRSLELVRGLSLMMPTGYLQLTRSDAMFLFIQQRSMMISTGSWDATSLISQVPFEVGVFRLPLPAVDDPVYGAAMLGAVPSEADLPTEAAFSLWSGSPHADVALDFLHFLTSQEGSRLFVKHSRWLPAIAGVEPEQSFRPFMPELGGTPNGFDAKLGNIGPEVRRIWEANLNLLGAQGDGVGALRDVYRAQFRGAVESDLSRWVRLARNNAVQQDTTLAALTQLARGGEQADEARAKFGDLFQQQNRQEAEAYWIANELTQSAKR
ncbi:extracellular solute-binding protein [Oleiharenicola lentus]|uniref:ABC transporter substrate-binding protein n=1 Tax=Oleiharenicola lentus TaxID=2508720 RepID=UPI003F661AC0